ncbi:MAG: T9SS type A sorting domain-containing protein [Lentimicrobium sp.]|nr:T9SS type A sorting domain-containing protein [Lentimicrobium sp.]
MKKLILLILVTISSVASSQHLNVMLGNLRDPNEPSIIINPRNTDQMLAGANIDNYYYSSDGGYTWQSQRLYSPQLGVWGDPCIIVDTTGSFYFFHLSNPPGASWIDRIVCQRTDDFTASWTPGTGIGVDGTKAQDKEWAVVDPATNNIYLTWTQFDVYGSSSPNDSSIIRFSKSTDKGETWSEPIRLNRVAGDCIDSDNTVEGAVPSVGPEGQIYVAWAGPEGIMFDRSLDGGETWLDNDIFVSDMPGGWDINIPGIMRANGFPVTACDLTDGPDRGTIYINWSDQRNGPFDTDVWLVKSTDGGETWSERKRVNDDAPGKHQFFTWMALDQATGKLWFVFYDRRNYSDNQTDVYMAMSDDGGESFTNFRVSESPFLPNPGIFFGDYNNISAYNDVVRPVWTRLNNNQLSIHTAIVDIVAVGIPEPPELKPLAQINAWPNPFSQNISFSYRLIDDAKVSLSLCDITGRKLLLLINDVYMPAGKYTQRLDTSEYPLAPGVYFFEFETPKGKHCRKVVYSP